MNYEMKSDILFLRSPFSVGSYGFRKNKFLLNNLCAKRLEAIFIDSLVGSYIRGSIYIISCQ